MKNPLRLLLLMITLWFLPNTGRAQDEKPLVHEAIINAPLDQVWAAYTTKAGLESWMVAHAEIDLKIGGKMKTRYDSKGTIDDSKAIENTILSYEPMRMLSFKVTCKVGRVPFAAMKTRPYPDPSLLPSSSDR